ncbi:MAG: PTS sugar transporter subunit IIA [Salana multivorans]|uniref:PTS sugar transporter subunit IIA n=1 Tax=Salana multivorans TaxID=120377 RepID=UPI00095AC239|nr:fructose PTS transporter subunit IIA [Salana multivorans]MBN8882822.1 PTS sugar transporter subunit IIA [Salana multivorans]OJX97808.1 MAG: PTS fructose transporter subunit IIA [Micrococcales bacterium 73-15]
MSDTLITADLVAVGLDAVDKDAVIEALAGKLAAAGRVTDAAAFVADVTAREAQTATGMPGNIGLPHAKSAAVTVPSLAVATVPGGVDFAGPDGPATLVFLIAAPAEGANEHLQILAKLARKLVNPAFTGSIRDAADADAVAAIVTEAVS